MSLPLAVRSEWHQHVLLLVVTDRGLELRESGLRRSRPVRVDFVGGRLERRRRNVVGSERMLAKAIGFGGRRLVVVDATAGLGRDAFLMACMGCTVTMFERCPVMAALLMDGVRRASGDPETSEIINNRTQVIPADARLLLPQLSESLQPDVVYLDPMFPARGKSALAKKEMRICRLVAGDDEDAGALLEVALAAARKRVVVKRPLRAPALGGSPHIVFKGTTVRYDVYLIKPG
ncbi:MAG TPA: class I SAM-dependent methyltransferase [Phycisphaerae bacterium]|nr:class I SAM-dependent methyltransferase [Phycisphaerae bacterium]HRR86139.1 class I SAM-dependent methyltransferase [Phycisphaerae bacterium]